MTDIELVQKIKETNDADAFQTLKERHLPLCTDRLKPYWSLLCSMGYSPDEILHERDLAISRAIRTYKTGSQVSTWIGNNVRYWMLNVLKKFNQTTHEPLNDNTESNEKFLTDYDINDFVDKSLEDLGPKVKLVFQERYVLNKKVREISRETGIPKHKISKMSKLARNYLKKKIEETECLDTSPELA